MSPIIVIRKNVKLWIRGLIATAINGFASGVVLIVADPVAFNLNEGLRKLVATSSVFAIFGLANYLKQHPLPDDDEDVVSVTNISGDRNISAWLLPLLLAGSLFGAQACAGGGLKPPVITGEDQASVRAAASKVLGGIEVAGIVVRDSRQLVSDLAGAGIVPIAVRTSVNTAVIKANEVVQQIITELAAATRLVTVADLKRRVIDALQQLAALLESQTDSRVKTAGMFLRSAMAAIDAMGGA